MNTLKEVSDDASRNAVEHMKMLGAISCAVYEDGADRIVYSVEPYYSGFEHHISVTRNGNSVANKTLDMYAAKLIPEFDKYQLAESRLINGLSHAWYKRKPPQ